MEECIEKEERGCSAEMQALVQENFNEPSLVEDAADQTEADRLREILHGDVKNFPSFTTFMRARWDPEFKNVKVREKHFHCRCPQCAQLATRVHLAARDKEQRAEYEKQWKAHHFEVKKWRQLETDLKLSAKTSPGPHRAFV